MDVNILRRAGGTATGLLVAVLLPLSAAELTTLDGKKLSGTLVTVDKERVTLRVGDAQVQIPTTKVQMVDLGRPALNLSKDTRYHQIELIDGSVLRVSRFVIKERRLEGDLLAGPEGTAPPRYELTLDAVAHVMRNAHEDSLRAAWKKLLANRGKRDLYVIREGDTLNFLQGTIHGGSSDGSRLDFERAEGERTTLLLSRATGGLVFAHPPSGTVAPTLCKVVDVFGNTLVAQGLHLLDDGGVQVTTVAGVRFHYPNLNALVRLDFSSGNVAYLSDLPMQVTAPEPSAEEKALRLQVHAPVLKDRSLAGETLKLAGHPAFAKGLLVAPDTVLTFELDGEYRELQAVAGLPEYLRDGQLSVQLTVEGDGRILFQQTLRRKDPARAVNLDIKGVRQLRLIVEGDFAINGNRLVLGDARILK